MSIINDPNVQPESDPALAPAPCSARPLPQNVLRLVLQIEDTPANREALESAYLMLQRYPFPTAPQHSILKLEQIYIASMKRLVPNAQISDPAQQNYEYDSTAIRRVRCIRWLEANMIREVTIVATFTTGTTVDDPEKAEDQCKNLLLAKLGENHTAGKAGAGELFSVSIDRVESRSL